MASSLFAARPMARVTPAATRRSASRAAAAPAAAFAPSRATQMRPASGFGAAPRGLAHCGSSDTRLKAQVTDTPAASTSVVTPERMTELVEFLKGDLPHLFDDQGIDASLYDDNVDFRDPITKYDSIQGYLFNIQMLRYLFSPTFLMNSIEQSDEFEITTRWTMEMTFALLPWRPTLTFTGLSVMGVNPSNGKFSSHLDLWDSVEDNRYFSIEGLQFFLKQVLDVTRAPDLETPDFRVVFKKSDYEVRRYEQFLVAQTGGMEGKGAAEAGGFNQLAGYIFGGNEASEKMDMTTPVITTDDGKMQFVVGGGRTKESAPAPRANGVEVGDVDGGFFGVASFSGLAFQPDVVREEAALRKRLAAEGLQPKAGYRLARYNDPGTPGVFRRNEVQIELEGFDMAKYMRKWGPV